MARGAQLGPIELAPGAVVRIGNWNQGGKCTVSVSVRVRPFPSASRPLGPWF